MSDLLDLIIFAATQSVACPVHVVMKSLLLQHLISDVVNTVLNYCVAHKEEKMNIEFRSLFKWEAGRLTYNYKPNTYPMPIQWRWWVEPGFYRDRPRCQPTVQNSAVSHIRSFVRGVITEQFLPARYIFSLAASDLNVR